MVTDKRICCNPYSLYRELLATLTERMNSQGHFFIVCLVIALDSFSELSISCPFHFQHSSTENVLLFIMQRSSYRSKKCVFYLYDLTAILSETLSSVGFPFNSR